MNGSRELVERRTFFTKDLIECLASHDTLLKKLTCDYLVEKCYDLTDSSLLSFNILLRDSSDPNPVIRANSILALSSLPGMADTAINVISKAFKDSSAQVRRSASHSCLKLFKHSPDELLASGLIDVLYQTIRDPDPICVSNCLINLEEILSSEGGIVINRNLAMYLVDRLQEFSNCNVIYVMNILKKFTPKKEDDIFYFINALDPFLSSANSSIILTSLQLFTQIAKEYPDLSKDLIEVTCNSLCKSFSKESPEVCYLILESLQSFNTTMFCNSDMTNFIGQHFKHFLIKSKDPAYLRIKKLEFLIELADSDNVLEIISDVKHYIGQSPTNQSVFKCLGELSKCSNDAERDVITILTNVLKNSDLTLIEPALECLITVLLNQSDWNGELHSTPPLTLTHTLCNSVSDIIINTHLSDNNLILVLRILQFLSPFLSNIQDVFDELLKRWDNWDIPSRCMFIDTISLSFLHFSSVLQLPLASVLNKAFMSTVPEIHERAAFVYAALEQGPLEAFNLLSISRYCPFLDLVSQSQKS